MAVVVVVYVDLVYGTEVEKKRAKTGNAQIGVERKGKEERGRKDLRLKQCLRTVRTDDRTGRMTRAISARSLGPDRATHKTPLAFKFLLLLLNQIDKSVHLPTLT